MRITLLFLLSCTFHNENFYTTEGHETREPKQDKETDGEGSRPQTVKWLREDQVSSACVGTGAGKDSARVLRKKWTISLAKLFNRPEKANENHQARTLSRDSPWQRRPAGLGAVSMTRHSFSGKCWSGVDGDYERPAPLDLEA